MGPPLFIVQKMGGSLQRPPYDEDAYIHGNCLFRLKNCAEAEDESRTAIGTDPRLADASTT
jgi:hypothetical protein